LNFFIDSNLLTRKLDPIKQADTQVKVF